MIQFFLIMILIQLFSKIEGLDTKAKDSNLVIFEILSYSHCSNVITNLNKSIHLNLKYDQLSQLNYPFTIKQNSDLNDENTNQVYYFNQERTEHQVLNPVSFNYFKFSNQCSNILIDHHDNFDLKTNELLENRLARCNFDIFIFISRTKSALKKFILSQFVEEIQFKIFLFKIEEKIDEIFSPCSTTTTTSTSGFYNFDNCSYRKLLSGRHLRVSASDGEHWIRYKSARGIIIEGAGVHYEMVLEISKRLNFTFVIILSPKGATGLRQKNGTWTGCMGELLYNRADFSITTGIVEARHKILDPTQFTIYLDRIFLLKTPVIEANWKVVFKTFSLDLWALIFGSLICTTALLQIKPSFVESLRNPFKSVIAIILEQSIDIHNLFTFRLRFFIIIWIFFSLLIGTAFKARLFICMTFLESGSYPETHEEIANSNYKLLFRSYNGLAYAFVTQSKEPKHKKILAKAKIIFNTITCIHTALLEDFTACMEYDFSANYMIFKNASISRHDAENPHQYFRKSKDRDARSYTTWMVRKGSPLRDVLGRSVLWTICSYLHDRWIQNDWGKQRLKGSQWLKQQKGNKIKERLEKGAQEASERNKPLTVKSLFGTFLLLTVGSFGGLCCFTFELAKKRIKKNQIPIIVLIPSSGHLNDRLGIDDLTFEMTNY